MRLQAVNSLDGSILDDYTLTKPSTWAANSTKQMATMTNFVGNFTPTWYESYGELPSPDTAVNYWELNLGLFAQECRLSVRVPVKAGMHMQIALKAIAHMFRYTR